MVLLSIKGCFEVDTSNPASTYLTDIIEQLAPLLKSESAGVVSRSDSTLSFQRSHNLIGRYNPSRVALFNPGSISIFAEGYKLEVRYRLGIKPAFYLGLLLALCMMVLFLQPTARPIFLPCVALSVFGLIVLMCFGTYRFRTWIKDNITLVLKHVDDGKV